MATKEEVGELLDLLGVLYTYDGGNHKALLEAWHFSLEDIEGEILRPALKELQKSFKYKWPKPKDFLPHAERLQLILDSTPERVAEKATLNFWGATDRLSMVLRGELPQDEWYITRHHLSNRPAATVTEYDNWIPEELEQECDTRTRFETVGDY